jgi:hypothetical protein
MQWRPVCRLISAPWGLLGLHRVLARSGRARAAAEAFEFGFQFADALLKFGQTIECGDSFEPLPIVDGGISGIHRTRRDVIGDPALCGDDGAVADGQMSGSANLAGENAAVAHLRGSCETYLAAKHRVSPYAGGMPDDDEVVELCSAADAGFSHGGAVDAGVGLHLDVVFKYSWTGLLHLVPRAVFLLGEAKAVAADDRSVLQDDAVSDTTEFAHHGVGVGEEIIANAGTLVNGDETVQNGIAADMGILSHHAIGTYVRACADLGGFRDECRRVESGRVTRSLVEKLDSVGEGEVRICGTQGREPGKAGVTLNTDAFFDEHRRGAGRLEKREVASIGEESDVARLGVFNSRDAVDGCLAGAVETAAEFLGNL